MEILLFYNKETTMSTPNIKLASLLDWAQANNLDLDLFSIGWTNYTDPPRIELSTRKAEVKHLLLPLKRAFGPFILNGQPPYTWYEAGPVELAVEGEIIHIQLNIGSATECSIVGWKEEEVEIAAVEATPAGVEIKKVPIYRCE